MHAIIETADIQRALMTILNFEPYGFQVEVFLEYLIDTLVEAPFMKEESLIASIFDMEMLGQPVGDVSELYQAAYPHLAYVIGVIRINIHALLRKLPHVRAYCGLSRWQGTAFVFNLNNA